DLAAAGDGERRDRSSLAVLDEQPGDAYVRDRLPDLPLVRLVHDEGLVVVGAVAVGVDAADVGEVAVLHGGGGLAGGRVGDLGEQLGGGVRGAGVRDGGTEGRGVGGFQ